MLRWIANLLRRNQDTRRVWTNAEVVQAWLDGQS